MNRYESQHWSFKFFPINICITLQKDSNITSTSMKTFKPLCLTIPIMITISTSSGRVRFQSKFGGGDLGRVGISFLSCSGWCTAYGWGGPTFAIRALDIVISITMLEHLAGNCHYSSSTSPIYPFHGDGPSYGSSSWSHLGKRWTIAILQLIIFFSRELKASRGFSLCKIK